MSVLKRKAQTTSSVLCLYFVLLGCFCSDPLCVAGQQQGTGPSAQPAELEDSEKENLPPEKLIPLAERYVIDYEKAHGPNDAFFPVLLNNLALLYDVMGYYERSEPLYQRSLAITKKLQGPGAPEVARTLNNLALLYSAKGDYARAEPLYQQALAILEKELGPDDLDVARTVNNFANFYLTLGDYTRAIPMAERALAIHEKILGPEHRRLAIPLTTVAALYAMRGEYARAELLYRRALAISEKTLGPENPDVALPLNSLATLYFTIGDYARAEPLYQRSLAITERGLGPNHPNVAYCLNNLALLYEVMNQIQRALQFLSRELEVTERNLSHVLGTGSERQKLLYLSTFSNETNATVSLHVRSAPSDGLALQVALTTVLRRKGRALDAMADQVASLRRRLDAKDRALLDQLSTAQSGFSNLVLSGPGKETPEEHQAAIARLEGEVERLQDAISRQSMEFSSQHQPVTIEHVRHALPEGAALVEFVSYNPFNAKAKAKTPQERFGKARYVAYVLRKEGEPQWADLGDAETIDSSVARLRAALKDPASKNVKELARALDRQVMHPLRGLLGSITRVFISPDGALNLVPFAALVDEQGNYLVESYSLTYLTSGRDLLRLQLKSESRQPSIVIADPLFGPVRVGGPAREEGSRRSAYMPRMYFRRLPGTSEEAKALSAALHDVKVLTQADATEAMLKQVSGPQILHIATHGFFLPNQPGDDAAGKRELGIVGEGAPRSVMRTENPLLRSGLALQGANQRQGARGEDGILTALEAAALDLWGTQLVVLSACETGVGEVKNGEGVYGLRRSLVLAGSESQVMSLWQVSDAGTRDLMVAYYKRLMAGEGRTEALRQVQLEMLRSDRQGGDTARGLGRGKRARIAEYSHPFYWASFIQSGDWRGMGERAFQGR